MQKENFKIIEKDDYAEIIPNDERYEYCMFFFSGFNEKSSKYTYQLKFFLESIPVIPIKIIIPYAPKYKKDDYPNYWLNDASRFTYFYAWFKFDTIKTNDSIKYVLIPNEEKDQQVFKMVVKEINLLGSSENIIFGGFSMGGGYLLYLLSQLKIKTKFNLIFKSNVYQYCNELKQNSYDNFNNNIFYLYYSIYDKLITFNKAVDSISILKKEFHKDNIHVKIDNNKKHSVDIKSLAFMEKVFKKHLIVNDGKF